MRRCCRTRTRCRVPAMRACRWLRRREVAVSNSGDLNLNTEAQRARRNTEKNKRERKSTGGRARRDVRILRSIPELQFELSFVFLRVLCALRASVLGVET